MISLCTYNEIEIDLKVKYPVNHKGWNKFARKLKASSEQFEYEIKESKHEIMYINNYWEHLR